MSNENQEIIEGALAAQFEIAGTYEPLTLEELCEGAVYENHY
jgi:hypothetical protein